jgi:hypothetical protein
LAHLDDETGSGRGCSSRLPQAFEEWAEVFNNDLLASAALDRLTHHTHTLTIRGSSYRQRQRRKEEHGTAPALPAESEP